MEEVDALRVVDLAVQEDPVVAGLAVLGDDDRLAVPAVVVYHAVVHHLRGHLPLSRGEGEAGIAGDIPALGVHHVAVVDVDADEIQRLHLLPVGGIDGPGEPPHRLRGALVVLFQQQGVQENVGGKGPALDGGEVEGLPVGGLPVLGGVRLGIALPSAGGRAHHGLGVHGLDGPVGLAVGQAHDMEHLGHLLLAQLPARRVFAVAVAQEGGALGLVEGHVLSDLPLEPPGHDAGVAAEGGHDVPVQPAALVLERAGQVPVVEGDHGLDAAGQQLIHQGLIELQALLVDLPVSVGDDPGPADGEAVGLDVVPLHQRHVLPVAVVDVAGRVAGVPVLHVLAALLVAEVVPDIRALSVLVPRALALVGGAGHAPDKILRKLAHTVTST